MKQLRALLKGSLLFLCFIYSITALQATTISAAPTGGIAIEGEIKPGDYKKFLLFRLDLFLKSKVVGNHVFLDSPGGNVEEALEFAEFFSTYLFSTYVLDGKSCFSACTIIWAGGVERNLERTGRLGFHRLSFKEKELDIQKTKSALTPANLKVIAFFKEVGFPNSIIEKMNETAPTDLFIIDLRWLINQDLITAISYQPIFLDVVEKRCGVNPTTAPFKSNQSYTDDIKVKFSKWLDCAEKVKDANRELQHAKTMRELNIKVHPSR